MITLGKRGRGLDPAVMMWLSTILGIGPGIGDVHCAVVEGSAFESWLRDDLRVHPSKIHFSLAAGEDALTASRNDTLLVYPGTYTVTSSLTWDKNLTHIVGLGGPLSRGGMGAGVFVNCETTTVAQVVDVQGYNVQMHGLNLRNDFTATANKCALKLSAGRNFFAQNCHFVAQSATNQVSQADNCGVWLYSSGAARPWGAKFKDCKIGDAGEIVRTAGGPIYFSGTSGYTLKDVEFENCRIVGWSETVGAPAVTFAANYCADRYVLFKDCLFFNYWVNNVDSCNQVFKNDCGTTLYIILMNCTAVGYDAWDDSGFDRTYGAMPTEAVNCGIGTQIPNA